MCLCTCVVVFIVCVCVLCLVIMIVCLRVTCLCVNVLGCIYVCRCTSGYLWMCLYVCVSLPLSLCMHLCVCLCVCIFGFVFDLVDSPRKRKRIHISTNVFSVSIMGHADPPRMFCHWGRRLDRFRSAEIDPGGGGTFEAKLVPAKPPQKSNPHGGRG